MTVVDMSSSKKIRNDEEHQQVVSAVRVAEHCSALLCR